MPRAGARAALGAGEPSGRGWWLFRFPRPALWLFAGLALALTLLFERSFAIDSDEGYTLNAAWQLRHGMRMYDDFRLFVGPGPGYAVLWLWWLVGSASHRAARLLAAGFSFSATLAFYLLLRRLEVRSLLAGLAVVVWMIVGALYVPLNHNSFSSYAAIWALLPLFSLLRAFERDAAPGATAAVAGVAVAMVFLFLPTKGALLAAAAALWLLSAGLPRRRLRPALTFVGAFAAVVALLCLRWRPTLLVQQWFLIPLEGNYLGHTGASRGALVLCAALAGAMGLFAGWSRDRRLALLAVVQAALYASTIHNLELHHVAINAFPAVLFAAVALDRRLAPASRLLTFPGQAVLATVAVTLFAWTLVSPIGARYLAGSTLSVDLLGHGAETAPSPRLAAAHAIYAGPFLPGLYYLLGKPNPYFVSETVVCDAACQRRLVGELEVVRPEVAFLNYAMVQHLGYDQDAPVDAFLRRRYVPCPDRGFFVVRAIDPSWCP
ncbi:MAG TPA: hypothetical protein VKZ18_04980 [Polyangia bacterium]|nr:hypothetical protein [Polyangia bacterium]